MKFRSLFVLSIAAALQAQSVQTNLITPNHTPTADAPVFGTGSYFRRIFYTDSPVVTLQGPVRLNDYVVGDKIELSLRNYLDSVLANNTDIAVQRVSVEFPRNQILRGYSIFDPFLSTSFNATRRLSPASDTLAGAAVPSTLSQPFSLRAQQMLPTGTTYTVGFDTAKFSTNSQFQTYNPSVNSGLTLGISQPLLRNRGMYLTKLPITIARSRLRQSEYNIQDAILQQVLNAEQAYWDVIFARENLKVQEQNLVLNQQLLKRAQRELELGSMSELEIYQPKAQYANAEIAVTQARYGLQQTEDILRRQMSLDLDPKLRNLPIVLTEDVTPPVQTPLDREDLVGKALSQRPDIKSFRQALDVDELGIQSASNQLKPDFRLTGTYAASGLGGNFTQRPILPVDPSVPVITPIIGGVIPGGFGDALGQVFAFNYPTYAFGLTLNLPLRDRRASADYADAVVSKRLDLLRLRSQEQQVRQVTLNAITQVENSRASVELAKVALDFAQKRLDGDQKRYDLGVITLFFLLDAQTALNRAQSDLVTQAVNYRRNLATLLRTTGDLLKERGIATQ